MQALAFGLVATWFCCGCESVKRVDNDERYFGEFRMGARYLTQKETIVTSDKQMYGEVFLPPKRLFLVAANTGAATNYVREKFSGLKRADPVGEIGRLQVGTRLEFIGVETVVVPFEPPRPAFPFAKILEGPFQGTEVCVYHLCADQFVWGWPRTRSRHSDLGNGHQIEVFSPCETFLVAEPK